MNNTMVMNNVSRTAHVDWDKVPFEQYVCSALSILNRRDGLKTLKQAKEEVSGDKDMIHDMKKSIIKQITSDRNKRYTDK